MSNIVKVAIACFIGAVAGFLSAVAITPHAPMFWWLGIVAGGIVGFFAYEIREVISAIPQAFKKAGAAIWGAATKKRESRPGRVVAIIVAIILASVPLLFVQFGSAADVPIEFLTIFLFTWFIGYVAYFVSGAVGLLALSCLNHVRKGNFWETPVTEMEYADDDLAETHYSVFLRNLGVGLILIIALCFRGIFKLTEAILRFFFWDMWRPVLSIAKFFLWDMWRFVGKLLYELFKLIYSNERLLCAVWSMIGATIGYLLGPKTVTRADELIFATVMVGIIGAGLGVINYRLISVPLGFAKK